VSEGFADSGLIPGQTGRLIFGRKITFNFNLTLTVSDMQYKTQNRTLIREGALLDEANRCQSIEHLNSGNGYQKEGRLQYQLAHRLSIANSAPNPSPVLDVVWGHASVAGRFKVYTCTLYTMSGGITRLHCLCGKKIQ
jgi:hypothetical protein